MTVKYFVVKGLNEMEEEFVSICKSKDMIDAIKMYRNKGLSVRSISFIKQAKLNDSICIESIRYHLSEGEIKSYVNSMMRDIIKNREYINSIDIGEYNYRNINPDKIIYRRVYKDIPIKIFPSINGKMKTDVIKRGCIIELKKYNGKLYLTTCVSIAPCLGIFQRELYLSIDDYDTIVYYLLPFNL